MNKKGLPLALVALLSVVTGPGCSTNNQGDTSVPVYLVVNTNESRPIVNIPASNTDSLRVPNITINSRLKNPSGGTSNFLDVKIDDYVVTWSRLDGGTKVPASETFSASFVVPAGGVSTLTNYSFMSISSWSRSPLDQLYPYNGGIDRETGRAEVHARMTITFRGHTLAGQTITTQGDFDVTFVYITTNATSSLPSGI